MHKIDINLGKRTIEIDEKSIHGVTALEVSSSWDGPTKVTLTILCTELLFKTDKAVVAVRGHVVDSPFIPYEQSDLND